ncbi:MAG: Ig-like domain-containing protein [Inhella sp.]
MADIKLSADNDVYLQPEADKDLWNTVFGEDGHDTLRLYQGTAVGGKGNDHIERLADPGNPGRKLQVAYWSAGDNLKVNLAEGWAEDGQGGRDTLIGVSDVHGSGARNAWVLGDAKDNYYWPNGGDDTFLGGAGNDGIAINSPFTPAPGQARREPLLEELDIQVSADGRSAVFKPRNGSSEFLISVSDVEYFDVRNNLSSNDSTRYLITDFIAPQTQAQQAIAAGGTARWNAEQALGSATVLSFSFVNQSNLEGFRAFTPAEQQAVRHILAATAQFTLLSFSEVAESGGQMGQLRFGVSQQAGSKGQANLPGSNGDQAGDVWMDVESMLDLSVGSEGYQALLHEIGHALGLRHPRNVDPGDAWAVQLREQDDRIALTVMSQTRSSDGLFRADWGPLDVLALRYLYGSRPLQAGDSLYTLGSAQSSALTTVIDDGGTDTLDASQLQSGVSLDLVPGHLGSAGISPAGYNGVDNLGLSAGSWIENAIGTPFDDVLLGNSGPNRLGGGLGNDWIDGAAGTDTAVYLGPRSAYELSSAFGKHYVRARDGQSGFDTLVAIEQLQFSDGVWPLSTQVLGADTQAALDEDGSLRLRLPDPSDLARSSVSYRLVGTAGHGSASLSSAGELSYSPAANYWGVDSLVFEMSAATGSSRYLVFLDVRPVNDGAPLARDAGFLVAGERAFNARLPAATDPDGDAISYALAIEPRNGVAQVQPDGRFSYTAATGFNGSDSFSFSVTDGMGGITLHTARLEVPPGTRPLIQGTAASETLAGGAFAEAIDAGAGNDRLSGGGGDDLIDGGEGIDTALFQSARSLYQLSRTDYGWSVQASNGEGLDRLANVERLQFTNTAIAFDLDGPAGAVAQILRALFGKESLSNKTFAGIGLQLFDAGMAYADVVRLAVGTDQFAQLAGGRSNSAFVLQVYKNVVGVAPSAAELASYTALLDQGLFTQERLALLACQSPLNTQSVELVGLAASGLEYLPAG